MQRLQNPRQKFSDPYADIYANADYRDPWAVVVKPVSPITPIVNPFADPVEAEDDSEDDIEIEDELLINALPMFGSL